MITEIAVARGDGYNWDCEDCAALDVRIGTAAVWTGIASRVAAQTRIRRDLHGSVPRIPERGCVARSGPDRVIRADAHGHAADGRVDRPDPSTQSSRAFVRLWAVRLAFCRHLSCAWHWQHSGRRIRTGAVGPRRASLRTICVATDSPLGFECFPRTPEVSGAGSLRLAALALLRAFGVAVRRTPHRRLHGSEPRLQAPLPPLPDCARV